MSTPARTRYLATVAMAVTLGLATMACTKNTTGSESATKLGEPVTAVSNTSTTTSAVSTTTTTATTTTLPGPVGVPEGEAAAHRLYDAWVANDRAAAATIADPAAIDAVFAAPKGTYELYRGCDTGEFGTGGCLFRNRANNNTIQIDLEKRDSGWVVSGAFFSAS